MEKFSNQLEWIENTLIDAVSKGNNSHTLETVNQPDKSINRIREEGAYVAETTIETKFKIIYNKRPKLDIAGKGKVTINVEETEPLNTNTSFPKTNVATVVISEPNQNKEQLNNEDIQMMDRHKSMETSSSHSIEEKDLDIKERYKQIKLKNEEIKTEIYSQFLKQKPGNQNIFLSAFDYSSKKLIMYILQPIVSVSKTVANYKTVDLEVATDIIYELDQMEFHQQTSEMLYSTVKTKAMSAYKLQNTISNMQDQMKMDKASLYAKDLRIKALEYLVLQIGYDPTNIKVAEPLVKKKNEDIAASRKQLKLPQSEHPQTKEVLQEQKEKDEMMNLILQLAAQIKEMEVQMDQLVQEKETVKEPVIPTVIPVITAAVPSTLGEKLAPKEPLAIVVPVTASTTSATESSTTESSTTIVQPTNDASKIVKEMEEMSLKRN